MKHRIILVLVAILLGIIILSTVYLKNPGSNGLCVNDFGCEDFWNFGVRLPIFYGLQYIIGILLIMAVIPSTFIKIWLKFGVPFLFLGLLLILSTPTDCSAPLMLCFNKLNVTQGLGKLLLIITGLIIITKSLYLWFVSKKNKKIASK